MATLKKEKLEEWERAKLRDGGKKEPGRASWGGGGVNKE